MDAGSQHIWKAASHTPPTPHILLSTVVQLFLQQSPARAAPAEWTTEIGYKINALTLSWCEAMKGGYWQLADCWTLPTKNKNKILQYRRRGRVMGVARSLIHAIFIITSVAKAARARLDRPAQHGRPLPLGFITCTSISSQSASPTVITACAELI